MTNTTSINQKITHYIPLENIANTHTTTQSILDNLLKEEKIVPHLFENDWYISEKELEKHNIIRKR